MNDVFVSRRTTRAWAYLPAKNPSWKAPLVGVTPGTYPGPAVRKKSLVHRPVVGVDIEETRSHDEDPGAQVDGIQDIVEDERFTDTSSHDQHHQQGDAERQEVRRVT